MLHSVDIPGNPALFLREREEGWMWNRGDGRNRRRGNYDSHVIYEKSIKKIRFFSYPDYNHCQDISEAISPLVITCGSLNCCGLFYLQFGRIIGCFYPLEAFITTSWQYGTRLPGWFQLDSSKFYV